MAEILLGLGLGFSIPVLAYVAYSLWVNRNSTYKKEKAQENWQSRIEDAYQRKDRDSEWVKTEREA